MFSVWHWSWELYTYSDLPEGPCQALLVGDARERKRGCQYGGEKSLLLVCLLWLPVGLQFPWVTSSPRQCGSFLQREINPVFRIFQHLQTSFTAAPPWPQCRHTSQPSTSPSSEHSHFQLWESSLWGQKILQSPIFSLRSLSPRGRATNKVPKYRANYSEKDKRVF